NPSIAAVDPARLRERQDVGLLCRIVRRKGCEHPDAPHPLTLLRARRERPRRRRAAEKCDELAAIIKKTRSHGTTAKRVGSAKRLRSTKDLPFSSSRVGRGPVRNSLDHLVGKREQIIGYVQPKRLCRLQVNKQLELGRPQHRQVLGLYT